jgi:hypothetical protein
MSQGGDSDDGPFLKFVPSRVEGLPDVSEVVVRPDRIELRSAGEWVSIRFADIARWPRPAWLWRLASRYGRRPRWLPVADRDWFHPPRDRFFLFYSRPPVKVYLADEDRGIGYWESLFRRMQEVIEAGGYNTFDLG